MAIRYFFSMTRITPINVILLQRKKSRAYYPRQVFHVKSSCAMYEINIKKKLLMRLNIFIYNFKVYKIKRNI